MGNKTLESLDPSEVWDIFEDIFCSTYRASKHEEQIRQKIKSWIKKKNQDLEGEIEIREDDAGNLLLKRPTNPDFTDCSALMLQGHMDMVTETNREGGFDFENEKIPAKIEENGEWVSADGTTLGADNGIGLAIALSILSDPDIKCGPLEMLITVDEETGLTGAFEMNVEELAIESKYLVNVDSEDLGVITVGSAGGGGTVFEKRFSTVSPSSI